MLLVLDETMAELLASDADKGKVRLAVEDARDVPRGDLVSRLLNNDIEPVVCLLHVLKLQHLKLSLLLPRPPLALGVRDAP